MSKQERDPAPGPAPGQSRAADPAADSAPAGPGLALAGAAGRAKAATQVVLAPVVLSTVELARLVQDQGCLTTPDPWRQTLCLKSGGAVVATGRLVRRGQGCWFRVEQVAPAWPAGDADPSRPVMHQTSEDRERCVES